MVYVPVFSTKLSLELSTMITEPMVSVRGTRKSQSPLTPSHFRWEILITKRCLNLHPRQCVTYPLPKPQKTDIELKVKTDIMAETTLYQ